MHHRDALLTGLLGLTAHDVSPDDPATLELWARFDAADEDQRRELVARLRERVTELVHSRPHEARPLADVLVRAATGLADLVPLALRGRATAAHFVGDHDTALETFDEARRLYLERGDTLGAANVQRSLVDVYQMLGRAAEALAVGDEARTALLALGEKRLAAQVDMNVGNVYTRLDEYPAARECYLRARDVFEEHDDSLSVAFTEFNRSVVEMNANRCDDAEEALHTARKGWAAANMDVHVAEVDYSLAYLHSRRGHFDVAIQGLRAARDTFADVGKPTGPPLCDLDLAEIHLRLDARRDALVHGERAAEAFAELGLDYELARAEVLTGLARARLGEVEEALADLDSASARLRGLGNEAYAAAVEVQRAAVQLAAGEPAEAAVRLEQAKATLAARNLVLLVDLATVNLALARLRCGDPEAALSLLEELGSRDADTVLDRLVSTEAAAVEAEARAALGDDAGAEQALRAAVDGIEQSWARVPGRDVRVAFFRDQHRIFLDLAWALSERGASEEALTILERGRARSLSDSESRKLTGDGELTAARERLDWLLARRLDAEFGPSTGDHELRRIDVADQDIRDAQRDVAALTAPEPGTAPSERPSFTPGDLAAARREDVLLAYMVTRHGTRVLIADDTGVTGVTLPVDVGRLRALRDRVWFHVDKLRLGREYVAKRHHQLKASMDAVLDELGDALLAPLMERIGDRPLVVVPYGDLHDLPFAALRVGGRYLVETHDVSTGLSTGLVARARSKPAAAAGDLKDVLLAASHHDELPAISAECAVLRHLYGDRVRDVEAERLPEHLRDAPPRGGLLHLAGHGRFESEHPLFSTVCLGRRFLLARDILEWDLDAQLVTLSGCETGRKLRVDGEELLGLSWALAQAGARATLGSLWAVDDADAGAFMSAFYVALAGGAPARAALCEAQRQMLVTHPHPCSWAAFALLGDPDVILPARRPTSDERA